MATNKETQNPTNEAIKDFDIGSAIARAYDREGLVQDGEPIFLKIWKSQGCGMPSAFDRCVSLMDNERLIDAKRFWIVRSDDLGEILAEDIESHPENWIGIVNDEGEIDFDRVEEGDIQESVEDFLDDWVRNLNFIEAADIDPELRREVFGAQSDVTFARISALGDYRTMIIEYEFDQIENAVLFLKTRAPWFEGQDLDFAAIMLATEDRDGFRFSTATPEEEKGSLDPIFDRWMGLA